MPFELQGHELPLELTYLWQWFGELNSARSFSSAGPNPLSFSEIEAWAGLTGNAPTATEVRLLKTLDAAWMQQIHEASEARQQFMKNQR